MEPVRDEVQAGRRPGSPAGRRSGEGARSVLEQMLQQEQAGPVQSPREQDPGPPTADS